MTALEAAEREYEAAGRALYGAAWPDDLPECSAPSSVTLHLGNRLRHAWLALEAARKAAVERRYERLLGGAR